jgi:hypothetical protein
MAQFVEAIPHLLLRVFAPALGITLVAWLIVLFIPFVRKQVRPVFSVSEGHGRRVPPVQWVVLFSAMAACTLFSGKNTNGVQNVGGGHLFQFNPPLVQIVSPQDVSNGWRVAEETDAESFAQPSANAITNELWRRRGAFDDALRIPANGWSYPYATGVTVLACGELCTGIRAHDFPCAFAQDISLLPLVSWPLLPEGRRESVFWYDTTSSNTLLTTWWNAALGRNATNPVNFQAELFPDGGFTYRYEDRTVRHARVWPFDWDNDGLENTVDPDPLTPGPDAHGTNAEWYNTVCSNLFSTVEDGGTGTTGILPVADVSILPWREGVNSNAYYFVDVVTERGPAPIFFTGDRESRLGNPVVVALAGVTNRVPLLIGIDYAITSPVPFAVSYPMDYMYPELETNELCRAYIRWPLNFVFTEDIGASNRAYTVTVEPYDPGGILEWNVTVPMRGGVGGDCGCVNCSGYSAFFTCSSTCTCSGGCGAKGRYLLETAEFPVEGGECRCGFDDPPDDDHWTPHGSNDSPSLTITFSKSAVIFENAYEDRPGVTMPRRSTRVRLTIDAYGGPDGGNLWLTGANLGNLVAVDGGVPLPYSQVLAAGESYHATGVYEGVMESGAANDVTVSGSLVPNEQGETIQSDAQLTVVRILLTPEIDPPMEATSGRHTYGVCEFVRRFQYPSAPAVAWNPVGGGSNAVSKTGHSCYRFPLNACKNSLRVEAGDAFYVPRLSCIEPSGIVVREVELCTYGLPPGKAGGIGLLQAFYVTPFTVSFSEIAVEEVPCDQGSVDGYFRYAFSSNLWTHTRDAGAGKWYNVRTSNQVGEYSNSRDEAAIDRELDPITPDGTMTNDYSFCWMDGLMVWQVPFGWHVNGTTGNVDPCGTFGGTTQEFYIDRWGHAAVRKFGNQATRRIDDKRYLNGIEVHNNVVK